MAFASAGTVNTATLNAALGVEATNLGTLTWTNGNTTISGGANFNTGFANGGVPRAFPNGGTISVSGATTLTGVGTKFTQDLKLGDMVGNAASGWCRVTSITNDTAGSVSNNASLSFSGITPTICECSTISTAGGEVRRVSNIVNSSTLKLDNPATANGVQQSYAGTIGSSGDLATIASPRWYAVYVVTDGTTVTCIMSYTRTAPLGATTYTSAYRRVGFVLVNSSGNVQEFSESADRVFQWEVPNATVRAVNGVTPAINTWTTADLNNFVPPTASRARVLLFSASGAPSVWVRPFSFGNSTVGRPEGAVENGSNGGMLECNLFAPGKIDWASSAAVSITIDVAGWRDDFSQ
jgi:hypothetical protein